MNDQQTQQLTKSDRIEGAIDKTTTGSLSINRHGQVNFVNANEIMEFAKVMALGKQAIPPHLRDNPGACMAVCIQASSWQMSPFAVANKSYVVNDRMAYEAQIIAAVILMRAPIIGRLKYTYKGEGPTRQCTCTAKLDDGDTVDYTTPMIKDIKVKNSPLWTGDPDQQLSYSAARSLARRHFPDVILGVYTPEEMAEETERDVTPIPGKPQIGTETQTPALPAGTKGGDPATPKPETVTQPAKKKPEPRKRAEPEQEPEQEKAPKAAKCDGNHAEPPCEDPECWLRKPAEEQQAPAVSEEDRRKLVDEVNERRDASNLTMETFKKHVAAAGIAKQGDMLSKYPPDVLQRILAEWDSIFAPPTAE